MKRHSKHSIYNPYAEINVIPLVDLTFNLLIIFMLATPLLESSINVKLPAAKTGETMTDKVSRVVNIEKSGRVTLDDIPVPLAALQKEMEKLAAKDSEIPVLVRADENIPYRQFVAVVDTLKAAGIKKMGIVTTRP
jgi:biopolymer transport protein ExbD